jgi:hypothetical protein
MSTTTLLRSHTSHPRPALAAPAAPRREYRERDFGVGYGRSSGYASERRYAAPWNGQPRFRCV